MSELPAYDRRQSYHWNFANPPRPVESHAASPFPGMWRCAGLSVTSPIGIAAGPLLNGAWLLYYAALGFDVLTYKTVRSGARECYPPPNLQPVRCGSLYGGERDLPACETMGDSWAVAFGMPSLEPEFWRRDLETARRRLATQQRLAVSVVGTVRPNWRIQELANDYAQCARWAVESGADLIEANFSCPNVATRDGQLYHQPADAALVAQAVRSAIGDAPLIIKVGHLDSRANAESLLSALTPHAQSIATTNSIAATVVDEGGRPLFGGEPRGICGRATFQASLAQTRTLAEIIREQRLSLTLIGVGGAATAADVKAYLAAGAEHVQLATAVMVNPRVGLEIRQNWQ